MPTFISRFADVDRRAEIGRDVEIGPFCRVGPEVRLGNGCRLESHVALIGDTTIGERNVFHPGTVIGGDPQDKSFVPGGTSLEIGDANVFREGVTVNVGAQKEDHVTRIGNRNLLMSNCHVAHNCHVYDDTILVNGVLLGGHVHVHDGAIISGNSVVHHFSSLGTLSFVSGGCRVPHDIPPFMLAAGSDNPSIRTINVVGMRRRGVPNETISLVKRAHRLLYRDCKPLDVVRELLLAEIDGDVPPELTTLLDFLERQREGSQGRAREAVRNQPQPAASPEETEPPQRRAA